jgi:hypothetical protein
MSIEVADVRRSLAYRTDGVFLQGVPSALWLCVLGLIGLTVDLGKDIELVLASWALIVVGIGWTAIALFRSSKPAPPLFVLSPAGILYRIPWVKEFLVPWAEIQGVDTIDHTTMLWATRYPHEVTFQNVTVVLVSKAFYDRHIFVDSLLLRGPGWGNIFIPKGPSIQMALHHELVSAEPRALREAVESRWLAFRDRPEGGAATSGSVPTINSKPAPSIAAHVENAISEPRPKQVSAWDITKIVIPLIGIAVVLANLMGFWKMPY